MICTVVGIRDIDFVDPNTKQRIAGTKIFVTYSEDSDSLSGMVSDECFIPVGSPVVVPMMKIGEQYDFVHEVKGFGKKAKAKLTKILSKDGKVINTPYIPQQADLPLPF